MTTKPQVAGQSFLIGAGHPLAAEAGAEVIRAGGNAIDAGVAAGLALSVVESELVGFGGVAPIILYAAEQDEIVTISGLGTFPGAIDVDYFQREHGGRIPPGILRTVMPAAPDAWITALARYGRMGFADVASHAIALARDGFPTYPFFHDMIASKAEAFTRHPSTAAIYLPEGHPPPVGHLFHQTDLGGALQHLADVDRAAAAQGGRQAGLAAARAAFYEGDIAATMVAHVQAEGGLMTRADLAGFAVEVTPAHHVRFGDWHVHGCGPWCQGPMLLQALNVLKSFDLTAMGHNSADYVHVVTEAVKRVAGDRDRFYGDPNFVDVPMDHLLSDAHASTLAGTISRTRAVNGGIGGRGEDDSGLYDTSYVCVTDAAGNAFSATPSDPAHTMNMVPGLGFGVSARGSQAWADPAHPSSARGGKRPRLTPNPALAVGSAGELMPFGSPGGDVQTQAMLQGFLNRVVFGMAPQEAVEAARFASYDFPSSWEPHGREPGVLRVEESLAAQVGADLQARGHVVEVWPEAAWQAGSLSLIEHDRANGQMVGGSDMRRAAHAIGG